MCVAGATVVCAMPRCRKAHPNFRRSGIGRRREKGTGLAYCPLREMNSSIYSAIMAYMAIDDNYADVCPGGMTVSKTYRTG